MNAAVDPALLRAGEAKGSTQSWLISHAKSVLTTTTPVRTQRQQAAKPTKCQRSRPPASEKPSMSTFAEIISNEVSDFIAKTPATKRTWLADDQHASNQTISSNSTTKPVPVANQFQPYREALAQLIAMYQEGKSSVDEVT